MHERTAISITEEGNLVWHAKGKLGQEKGIGSGPVAQALTHCSDGVVALLLRALSSSVVAFWASDSNGLYSYLRGSAKHALRSDANTKGQWSDTRDFIGRWGMFLDVLVYSIGCMSVESEENLQIAICDKGVQPKRARGKEAPPAWVACSICSLSGQSICRSLSR